jgi:alkylation response protein AidB-like acyl-CoA dehydrogenase
MAVFEFTDEHRDLRSTVRALLDEASTEPDVRRAMELPDGFDRALWDRLAGELGLAGLVVPEESGGAGAGLVEAAVVLQELGRALCPGPFLTVVIAELALLRAGEGAGAPELLAGLATGETIATVALAGPEGRWDGRGCRAGEFSAGWRIDGERRYVADAHVADVLLTVAHTNQGPALFAVAADAPDVAVRMVESFDLSRRLGTVRFEGAPAQLVGQLGDRGLADVLDLARVAVAAEESGGARAVLDMAVEYAKQRVQFGRAIGSFQAIKHLLADALLDVESAHSAAFYAAWTADETPDNLASVAPLTKAWCSDTYLTTASLNMQVHGGLSFTWEHPAHLYYRRARSGKQLWGSPTLLRDELASQIGLGAA